MLTASGCEPEAAESSCWTDLSPAAPRNRPRRNIQKWDCPSSRTRRPRVHRIRLRL